VCAKPTCCPQTFPCVTFEDGRSYLQADLSLSCQTETHRRYVLYASAMACVMVIMIPAFYFVSLWRHRASLVVAPDDRSEDEQAQTKHLAFLVQDYRPEVWYFEVVEMVRKVFLTGVAVLVFNGTLNQIAIGLLVCLASLLLYTHLRPFANAATNTLATLAQLCLFLTLFGGMMFKAAAAADAADEISSSGDAASARRAQQRWLTAAIIIGVNLMVPLVGGWLLVYKHVVQPWQGLRREHPHTSRCGILCMTMGVPKKHAHSIRKCIGVACGCNRRRAARRSQLRRHRRHKPTTTSIRDTHSCTATGARAASGGGSARSVELAMVTVPNPLRGSPPPQDVDGKERHGSVGHRRGGGTTLRETGRAARVLSMRSLALASVVGTPGGKKKPAGQRDGKQ